MDLGEILENVRDHYLGKYRAAISTYRERFDPSATEVLLELSGDAPLVYRYYRADLASGAVDPPNFTEVNPESHLEFEPTKLTYEGLEVFLSPIVWNGVEVRVEPRIVSDEPVRSWGTRWIDPDEQAEADGDGLGTYVHSVTAPESDVGSTHFSIDLGSAPVASLLELLVIVRESGAFAAELHSRAVLGESAAQ